MKKNNNGFTLIELLAIIVILAIIAVITVPLILNVIEDSKKGAAQDSSYGYKDAIEKFIIEQMGKNYNFKLEDKTYTTEELKNLGLKVGGQEPTSGKVKIEKNIIKSFTLQYEKFTCNYPVNNKIECGIGSTSSLTITNINLESTSNSITVTTTVKGNVSEYLYKIGNEEFVSSDSNTYTFNNLDDNTEYEITVKVKNETEEVTKSAKINTKELGTINVSITPQGYSYEKNIRFDLNENLKVYIKSTENITSNIFATICTEINNCGQISTGELEKDKWYMIKEDTTLTATSNLNIIYVLSDGINITEEATVNVVEIDRTAPTNLNVETTNTENSITVTATSEDNESGIAYYQFSNDAGNTWTELKPTNTHTFENLTESSYDIKVRVINGTYDNEQDINALNSLESENKTVKLVLEPGDAIIYGGYNWHIIREYEENGTTYQTLLMDAGQLDDLAHCPMEDQNYCDRDLDDDFKYSWDKSKIQDYLNNTFIQDLQSNGVDTSKIKKEQVCVDPSISNTTAYSYGGYTKEEVDSVDATCSKYEEYQFRLVTRSEWYNLSYAYSDMELPYEGKVKYGGNAGKFAKIDGIERLSENESKSWLCPTDNSIWTMATYSSSIGHNASGYIFCYGNASYLIGQLTADMEGNIRPVITIIK